MLLLMALFGMHSKNLQVIQLTITLLLTKKRFLLHIDIREAVSVSLRNREVKIRESTNQATGFL
jgi:ABC-type transport system involved in cytochrome c biogenesis permease component